MADLLDNMLVELAQITQTVADLEEQEEEIRLKLVKMRALQAELLGTAECSIASGWTRAPPSGLPCWGPEQREGSKRGLLARAPDALRRGSLASRH
jgi:hypothetical protein